MENKTRLQFLADQYPQAVETGYTGTFEDFLGLSNRDEFSATWALTALRSIVMEGGGKKIDWEVFWHLTAVAMNWDSQLEELGLRPKIVF